MMSKQLATSTTAIASSPPPPTATLESSKTLNPAKIVQPDRVSATSENKEIDIKHENDLVPKLKGSFILGSKSDIVEIGDDVLNLSTTHAIIEQHLVDTKSKLPLSQNNWSNNASDKEELCDNAFIIPMPQLVNEHDVFLFWNQILVLKINICFQLPLKKMS